MQRIGIANWLARPFGWMLSAVASLVLITACGSSENLSPSAEPPSTEDPALAPADSSLVPPDSTATDTTVQQDTVGLYPSTGAFGPGIPFGAMGMQSKYLNSLYRASKQGLDPQFTMNELSIARSKTARMILEMASKNDERIQNLDGTFSYAKWKALVDGFKPLALNSYITDGTLMGHFLVDEPENVKKWGGKPIPHATVEAMAKYSKQLWPGLMTFVRAPPTWLAKSTMTFVYLDAAWAQYGAFKGAVGPWIAAEVNAAKAKRVGLMTSLNVLDGGNGSSGIRGWLPNRWTMTAAEIKSYGTTILAQSYACGFLNWTWLDQGQAYFSRTDVKASMTALSNLAKAHAQTSCRQ